MKKTRISALLLLVLFQLFFQQCARETTEIVQPDTFQDTDTPDDINEWIEQQETTSTPLDQLVFTDGQSIADFLEEHIRRYKTGRISADAPSPEYQKRLIIASMGKVAQHLCNRENFIYPAIAPDGPAQKGLVYSWGQSNYKIRALPPSAPLCPNDKPCTYKIYGLDCSGFITNLLREATDDATGTLLFQSVSRENSTKQAEEKFWNNLLKQNPKLDRIEMKKKGKLTVGKIEPGDIIHWPGHIAYVFYGQDGKLKMLQSNGKSSDVNTRYGGPNCNDKTRSDCNCPVIEYGACKLNYTSDKRGVHEVDLTQDKINAFGKNYEILRFTTKLEGKWTLQLKCDWAEDNDVAVVFEINIPDTQDGKPFTAKGKGTDYDGDELFVEFVGEYEPVSRKLKGELRTTSYEGEPNPRIDKFETILPADDSPTSWITLISIYREDDTCIAQIKMDRANTAGGNRKATPKLTKQNLLF
jgi:hypothetical protein